MNKNHVNRAKLVEQVGIRSESRGNRADPTPDRSQSHISAAYVRWLAGMARRLDRLRSVPRKVLGRAVVDRGACMAPLPDGDPPTWLFDSGTDREIATRLCAGCPVVDECLELELRLFGADTVGVWGALSEDDRRALHAMWLRRRARTRRTGHAEGGGRR